MLLDEPTKDLDVETLRSLEEGLLAFAGCAVIISHDCWFLNRIATHMSDFEGDSRVAFFEGNFADYEEDKKSASGFATQSRRASAIGRLCAARGAGTPKSLDGAPQK